MVVGWPFGTRGGIRRDEEAVSEVLGTVLLVAVTVVMAGAFALLLGSFGKPTNLAHADIDIRINAGADNAWGTNDDFISVRHMGGEPLDSQVTTLIVRIGSAAEERFTGAKLESDFSVFSDGKFEIGESLLLPRSIPVGTTVHVLLTSGEGGSSIIGANSISPGGVSVPGGIHYQYPSGHEEAHGNLADFTNLQAADDVTGTYTEEQVSVSDTETRTASTATATGATTSPGNALASDDAYAVLPGSGDTVRVSDWGAAGSTTIGSVTAYLESNFVSTGTGGSSDDRIKFTYFDDATPVSSQDYAPTASDSVQSMTLTPPGGSWDWTDIANLRLEAEYLQQGGADKRDFQVDAMWIDIEVSGLVYSLEGNLTFMDVPDGNQWVVEARYAATGDEFQIEVLNPGGGWTACGPDLNSAVLTDWSGCSLTTGQYNGGSPTVRVVDATGSGTQGSIEFDYVRIRTT